MRNVMILTMLAVLTVSCTPKNADEAKTGESKKVTETSGDILALDIANSTVYWRGTKPSGEHVGTVGISKGLLHLENNVITGGSMTIDLDAIVNTDMEGEWNAKLVGHLKSEDFFYTEMYPEATFEISSLSAYTGETTEGVDPTHNITGNLTMRGVTKSISFPAEVYIEAGSVSVETNEFSIDRTLWGVNFKSKTIFAEFKDDFIGDMINLKLNVKFAAE